MAVKLLICLFVRVFGLIVNHYAFFVADFELREMEGSPLRVRIVVQELDATRLETRTKESNMAAS